MFSKALFKQSCKANGTMWGIITVAVCFMLACVMLISGNGNIGEVKNAIEDTIITKEIDAQLQSRAITYYRYANEGLETFDTLFTENATDTLSYLVWCGNMPQSADYPEPAVYAAAMEQWQAAMPQLTTQTGSSFAEAITQWQNTMPVLEDFDSPDAYAAAMGTWQESSPATQENAVTLAYADACTSLQEWIEAEATANGFKTDSTEANEMLGSVMYTLNPNGMFDDFYTDNGAAVPADYDVLSLVSAIATGEEEEPVVRETYRQKRAENGAAVFLAGNMTAAETVDALLDALSSYGVTREKYNDFGYTFASIDHIANTAITTYQGRLEYEMGLTDDTDDIEAIQDTLAADVSTSFLSTLPDAVSEALEEIGQADLYTLIVGSIFYKLAGLLLPIIYMIMASNNLVAGQVDSGSMAYVLSTSTKRSTVVFTQAVYLIGSLFAMFGLTTVTGCICLSLVPEEIELTYGNLLLLNVGAFLVLFALSGLCFATSCLFDRSKRSMAIGGGLSIFALVAAMLGLFGSPVIPSVVRLESLNYFNYTTIISLFDVISIIDGTNAFIGKFVILAVLGVVGYIVGSARFVKKDLPL